LIASAQPKAAWQLKLARYSPAAREFDAAISRFDCRFWDSLFRGFALDCCAGERSIHALGQL